MPEYKDGAGALAISESTGMDIEEVKKFIKAEEQMYPGVVKEQNRWIEEVNSNAKPSKKKSPSGLPLKVGWMRAPSGRRYVFTQSEWNGKATFKPTEIKNYIVQGTAAELMILWIGRIWRSLMEDEEKEILMVNTIHDSVLFDVKDWNAMTRTAEIVKKCTEELPALYEFWYKKEFNCRIRCDIKYGGDWKEMYELPWN